MSWNHLLPFKIFTQCFMYLLFRILSQIICTCFSSNQFSWMRCWHLQRSLYPFWPEIFCGCALETLPLLRFIGITVQLRMLPRRLSVTCGLRISTHLSLYVLPYHLLSQMKVRLVVDVAMTHHVIYLIFMHFDFQSFATTSQSYLGLVGTDNSISGSFI